MKYIAYPWPEYQDYMGEDWFRDESYYDPDADTYLIPENRIREFDEQITSHEVGDMVTIKSLEWYDKNADEYGDIVLDDGNITFISDMSKYCGKIATIINRSNGYYALDIDEGTWDWSNEMFE